jgi:hypothetical protein
VQNSLFIRHMFAFDAPFLVQNGQKMPKKVEVSAMV